MGISAFASIAGLIDVMLSQWIISLGVLVAFIVLFIWLFKGWKTGIIATLWVLFIAGIAVIAAFAVSFFKEDVSKFVAFAIAWVPTILFLLIVFIATLMGIKRGLRKSVILFVQAICAMAITIAAYFLVITSPEVDKSLLGTINFFMGSETGLQDALGVTAECATFKETFAEYLLQSLNSNEGLVLLLSENRAYLMTIVDLGYRLAFAVVFYLLYQFLVFLLFLIYKIFYSERKYIRKKTVAFANGKTDSSYKKHRVGGGIVGFLRGLVVGTVVMSFIGSAFFIVAGGTGEGKLQDYDFGDENTNFVYDIYRSVESYGTTGIFKVLNSVKDPNDSPYYLFAADLVFSGAFEDEEENVGGTVSFRKELSAYTGFARDTMSLLMKYGGDSINKMLKGETGEETMDEVLEVMAIPEFRLEFENLVDNFDSQTYIINFALSLTNTLITHLDEVELGQSVSADNVELLKVLFCKGYLSEVIPDERELRQELGAEMVDDDLIAPPCFSVNHLFEKDDAQIILRIVLSVLSGELQFEPEEGEEADPLGTIMNILPQIEGLSIFGTERQKEVNPVLARLYCYVENKYLTPEGMTGIRYSQIRNENVSWSSELRSLVDVSGDLIQLFDNVRREDYELLQTMLEIFNSKNVHYEENIALYDNIINTISDSVLFGKVLASGFVRQSLQEGFQSLGDVYIPADVVYENSFDSDGNLVSYGETFRFFYGLRLLGDKDNAGLIDMLMDASSMDILETLEMLADAVTKKDDMGFTLADYMTESKLLRSVISTVLIDVGGDVIKVPSTSCEKDADGNTVNYINQAELKQVFDSLDVIVELIKPLFGEEFKSEDVVKILDNEQFNALINSGNGIIEGTISNILIDQLKDSDFVKIPVALTSIDGWVSVYGAPGELRKVLAAYRAADFDIAGMIDGTVGSEELFDTLRNLEGEDIRAILNSKVMHYTISSFIESSDLVADGFTIIVPATVKQSLQDDVIPVLINSDELYSVLNDIGKLGISSDFAVEDILYNLLKNKSIIQDSRIISATMAHFIVHNDTVNEIIKLPELYIVAGAPSELAKYGQSNPWFNELPALMNVLDEIFGISMGAEHIEFSSDAFSDKLSELLQTLNKPSLVFPRETKLELCYDSAVLTYNLTVRLDDALQQAEIDEAVIADAKDTQGVYKYEEMAALADTVDLFDLDLLNLDSDELKNRVSEKIININDPQPDFDGRSTLDVIYPSAIIRNIVTKELDRVLNEPVISPAVRDGAKRGSTYPKEEISALVTGIQTLGIQSIDDIQDYDFSGILDLKPKIDVLYDSRLIAGIITYQIDDVLVGRLIEPSVAASIKQGAFYPKEEIIALFGAMEEFGFRTSTDFEDRNFSDVSDLNEPSNTLPTRTRLNVVYESKIVAGIITKAVQDGIADSGDLLADTVYAYENGMNFYKEQEVASIVELLGGVDFADFDLGSVSEFRDYVVPDNDGEPKSYLVCAAVSVNLINNTALVIPTSAVASGMGASNLIYPQELTALIDAFVALRGNASGEIDEWNVAGDLKVPTAGQRNAIVASEIMRATFATELVKVNSDGVKFKSESVVAHVNDIQNNTIAVITKEQMLAIFDALEKVYASSGSNELKMPEFQDVNAIIALREYLPELYKVDHLRYQICELLQHYADIMDMPMTSEEILVLREGVLISLGHSTAMTCTYEELENLINKIASFA